jgi:hypothetical protein
MSVGIAVLNKSGIAIAADSATTMGERLAIYNSAEKVFHVSAKHPLVLLKYGTVLFMRVPNEMIIKQFGQYLDKVEPLKTLKDYKDSFIRFIEQPSSLFNFASAEENLLDRELYNMLSDFNWYFHNRHTDIPDHQKRIEACLNSLTESQQHVKLMDNYDVRDYLEIHHQGFIKNFIKEHKINNIFFTAKQVESLYRIYLDYHHRLNQVICGFAFNGYGKNDLYPTTFTIQMYGLMQGKLKYAIAKDASISDKYPRSIMTFAQDVAIHTYLDGIDPEINYEIQQLYINFVSQKIDNLPQTFSDKQKDYLRTTIFDSHFYDHIYERINDITRVNWGKTYDAVETLPEEELVKFAEFLVDLCSFKSKYSLDKQLNMTVGGPADVVLITKSDGVLWYKKKNQGFFRVQP